MEDLSNRRPIQTWGNLCKTTDLKGENGIVHGGCGESGEGEKLVDGHILRHLNVGKVYAYLGVVSTSTDLDRLGLQDCCVRTTSVLLLCL